MEVVSLCRFVTLLYETLYVIIFSTDMVDPNTKKSPYWKAVPNSIERATEGRNKALYCLGVGR